MKINYKKISKMILKKSNKYLKISVALFAFSLILLSTFLTLFVNQYMQVKRDFIDNDNTHIVEVFYAENQNNVCELKFSDIENIDREIKANHKDLQYDIVTEYQLNFGIEDENHNTVFIYGLSDNASRLLNGVELKNDNIYQNTADNEYTNLQVPVISTDGNGLISDDIVSYRLKNNTINLENTIFNSYKEQKDRAFVNFETYKKIIEQAYNINWNDFEQQFNKENIFGIQAIHKMLIHVSDLNQVEKVAKTIDSMGFATNYTFKSFDDFAGSMNNTVFIFVILVFTILIITIIYIILSFNSYLKVQQKDMGILKQYGYSEKKIHKIYSRNINSIFIKVFGFITIFSAVIGLVFIGFKDAGYILSILGIVSLLQYIINRVIVHVLLKSYTKKNIIDLLKKSKEFE